MSNASDFIIENGVLKKYVGPGGEVVIPEGVTQIANVAFNPFLDGIALKHMEGRKNVKSVVIPEGVTQIGERAFASCEKLSKVTVPQTLTRVGDAAFQRTPWLKKQTGFVLLNNVLIDYVGDDTQIIIPGGVTAVADGAFQGHKQITCVQMPETVTYIGKCAFRNCSALEDIQIPSSVTEIGFNAFGNTPWLQAKKDDFVVVNGILYAYQGGKNKVQIPETVTAIGPYAFASNQSLTSVKIPDSVTRIGESAFSLCGKLKSIAIPDGVTTLESNTFYGCENLVEAVFSNQLRRIDESAFCRCEKLKTLPDMNQVEFLGEGAFYGCRKLADKVGRIIVKQTLFGYADPGRIVEIPEDVVCISPRSLEDTEEVEQVIAPPAIFDQVWGVLKPANKQTVAMNCLKNNAMHEVATAYIKKNKDKFAPDIIAMDDATIMERFLLLGKKTELATLEKYIEAASGKVNVLAFLLDYKSKRFEIAQVEQRQEDKIEIDLGLRERTMKEWKEVFKLSVADGCVRIAGYKQTEPVVQIPESMDGHPVTTISDGAFKDHGTIESILLPSSITEIGANAFRGCIKLESIVLPEAVESIGHSAFGECTSLQNIVLPQTIKYLRDKVFMGCAALKQVTLPEGLELVLESLFDGCHSLETVRIPDTVKEILDYAFRDCKALQQVVMPAKLTTIGQGAFTNCKTLTELVLPDGVKEIDHYAFRGCTKLTKIRIPATAKSIRPDAFNGCKKLTIHAPIGCRGANLAKANKIPFVAE